MKGLLIRLDDITPDMNWNKFNKLTAIFDQYRIYPLLGIVPDNQDPQLHIDEPVSGFAERMLALQSKGYVLAQHGYQHVYETEDGGMLNVHRTSEFAGLSFAIQVQKLLKGKELLEQQGIYTDIFMAPGHAYDETTLKALQQTRFRYVTDGYGCTPYRDYGLQFIPCTLTTVKDRAGIDTICLHANTMSDEDIRRLEQEIATNQDRFLTWQQVLEMPVQDKNARIARQEQKELKARKQRAFAASNESFQRYLQKSNASNKYIKMMKRVLGLPALGIHLLLEQHKKE